MLFQTIDVIFSSSLMIILLLLVRGLLKGKLNPKWQYALWGIILIRLFIPVSLPETGVQVVPRNVTETVEAIGERQVALPDFRQIKPEGGAQTGTMTEPLSNEQSAETQAGIAEKPTVKIEAIAAAVWGLGAVSILSYLLIVNRKYSQFIKRDEKPLPERAVSAFYEISGSLNMKRPPKLVFCEHALTPSLYGLFRPKLILNSASLTDDKVLEHVILHELIHYRQKDHVFAFLRNLCCAIYWFNPLVWAGAAACRHDAEKSCDTRVLEYLNKGEYLSYAETLLKLVQTKPTPFAFQTATTMSAGKREMKERLRLIVKQPKKAALWRVVTIASAAAVCLAACSTISGGGKNEANSLMASLGYSYEQLEKIQKNKTPYVGDNAKVGGIIQELPVSCKAVAYDHFALQTEQEPYGLTVYYKEKEGGAWDSYDFIYDDPYRNSMDENNALLLFASIDNLSKVTFSLSSEQEITFTREQIEAIFREIPSVTEKETLYTKLSQNLKIEEAFFSHASRYYLIQTTPEYLVSREGREPDHISYPESGVTLYEYEHKNGGVFFYFKGNELYRTTSNREDERTYEDIIKELGPPVSEEKVGNQKHMVYHVRPSLSADSPAGKPDDFIAYFIFEKNQLIESGLMAGEAYHTGTN